MKKLYIIFGLILITLTACPQKKEQTFHGLVKFEGGIMLKDGKIYYDLPIGISSVTWDLIQGKPVNFLPSAHTHLWSDVTNNPANLTLQQAIEGMDYFPIPQKTTEELSKLVMPDGHIGLVFNKSDSTFQIYYNKIWHHFILDK